MITLLTAPDIDGNVLTLLNQALHAGGRDDLALLVVRQMLDVAKDAGSALIGGRTVRHIRYDSPVKEEAIILERQTAPEADLPCDGERQAREARIVVDAGDRLADLLRSAVVPLDIVSNRKNLSVRLHNLLAYTIEDQHRPAAHTQEFRDLIVALLRVIAGCEEAHTRHAERSAELVVDRGEVLGRAGDSDILGHYLTVLESDVGFRVRHVVAADTDLTVLLDDGVKGCGDQRDRVQNRKTGDVNLRPLVNGLISLVNPDVDLLLEDL